MPPDPSCPHDRMFRKILASPADAASEMQVGLCPEIVAAVDWDTLERMDGAYVSKGLHSRFSDLVFRARTLADRREIYLHVLLEHQSSPDPLMAFRMLDYCVGFTNNYLRDHPKAKRIPAVISLVVHVGPKGLRWNAPLELTELFDLDLATRATPGDHLPRLRYHLDDVNALDTQALLQRPLTPDTLIVLFLERTTAENPNLVTDLAPIMPLLRARSETSDGLQALQTYATYLETAGKMSPADLELFADQFGPAAKEVIVTTADMLRAEGEARAEARWRAASLLELLTEKFGVLAVSVEQAIRDADTERLKVWNRRVLTATTLDEVLA